MDFSQELIQDYLISHSQTTEKTKWSFHVHPNAWEFLLFKKGNVDYYINNRFLHLKPGDLLMIPPNFVHGYLSKDATPYERFPVHISTEYGTTLYKEQPSLRDYFSTETPRFFRLSQKHLTQYEFYVDAAISYLNEEHYGNDLFVRSTLYLLFLLVNSSAQTFSSSTNDTFPEIMQLALAYIDAHCTEKISTSLIAEKLNISPSRLCHIFKDFMGISLWNYVITRRIQTAQTLLKEGIPIIDVCYECGFSDYSHFIRSFSKIVGTPPKKYVQGIQMNINATKQKKSLPSNLPMEF